jgi:hypothetical protein
MPLPPTSHLFFRPATLQAFAGGGRCDSKPSIQFGVGNHFSVVQNLSGYSGIRRLLNSVRPLAIFWAVVSIIINPLDAESFRLSSHVGDEVFKRISPPVTYGNTTPSVISEVIGSRVFTSFDNSTPNIVERMGGGLYSIDDFSMNFRLPRFTVASARGSVSLANIRKANINGISAIAATVHRSNFSNSSTFTFGLNDQFSIAGSAFDIQFFRHEELYNRRLPSVNTFLGKHNHFTLP